MAYKKLVSKIAQLREEFGLTQREVAQLLQVTETTVANWEKGRSSLEWFRHVAILCRLFNCSPDDLIEYVKVIEPVEKRKKGRSYQELRQMIGADEDNYPFLDEEISGLPEVGVPTNDSERII